MEFFSYMAEAIIIAFFLGAILGGIVAIHLSYKRENNNGR